MAAIIPAAGEGRRMGAPLEKQFLQLEGMPILLHTLKAFESSSHVHGIVVVVPSARLELVRETILKQCKISKLKALVAGGPHRQDSVRLGLEALGPEWDMVVVHDGARPLVEQDLIARCVEAAAVHGAAIAAVPATDTVKEVDSDGFVVRTLPRNRLWMVQTPQVFRYTWILRAHQEAQKNGFLGTDDASLVERLGHKVKIVQGSYENIKVTTKADLKVAGDILASKGGARP
ncbi:MAG: 2-C-methyl-D-erythritol 4-phosphate cytidylyltransferase [bacterium]